MPDTLLRSKLIRLAASRPDLRADLLPLLSDRSATDGKIPRTKEDLLKFMYDIDWKKSWRKSNSERAERKKVVQAVADDAIKKFYHNPKMKSIVSQSFEDYGEDEDDFRIDIRDQVLAGVGLNSERLNEDDLNNIIERITDDVEKIVFNHGFDHG